MDLDPKSVLEIAQMLAQLGTSIAEFAKSIGEGKPNSRNEANRLLNRLIDDQNQIQLIYQQTIDDYAAAIDENSTALNRLATAMNRRTKTLNEFIEKIDGSDIEDKAQLSKAVQMEIKNLQKQQRLLNRERTNLNQKFETLNKQADEIARISKQMVALKTLIAIRFGGQE